MTRPPSPVCTELAFWGSTLRLSAPAACSVKPPSTGRSGSGGGGGQDEPAELEVIARLPVEVELVPVVELVAVRLMPSKLDARRRL